MRLGLSCLHELQESKLNRLSNLSALNFRFYLLVYLNGQLVLQPVIA